MKKIILFLAAISLFAACDKDDAVRTEQQNAIKVTDLKIPASFDWQMTTPVTCNITAPHATKVFVTTQKGGEPFATFVAGDNAKLMKLEVPNAIQTLYVSYATATGVSAEQAVSIQGGAITCALAADGINTSATRQGATGNRILYPMVGGYATLMFEDLWPAYGDYDFNDCVVNYTSELYLNEKNDVKRMIISLRVAAVGGSLPNDFNLAFSGISNSAFGKITTIAHTNTKSEPVMRPLGAGVFRFENIRQNVNKPAGSAYLNTEPGFELSNDQLVSATFEVEFNGLVDPIQLTSKEFNFFLSRVRESDGRHIEIHMGGYKPTVEALNDYNALHDGNSNIGKATRHYFSNDNLIWALNIPFDALHAYENVDFNEAYPNFKTWAQSGGTAARDWYLIYTPSKVVPAKK
ncbi:MAG: LruC domain-containing protein [Alistipes sp.]